MEPALSKTPKATFIFGDLFGAEKPLVLCFFHLLKPISRQLFALNCVLFLVTFK